MNIHTHPQRGKKTARLWRFFNSVTFFLSLSVCFSYSFVFFSLSSLHFSLSMFVWQSFMSASFFPFKALQLLIVCMCFYRVDSYFSSLWMCCGSVELSSHILCVPFDGWTINFTLPILFASVYMYVYVFFKFSPFVSVRFSVRFIQFFLNIKHCQYWCNTVYLILAGAPIRILDVSVWSNGKLIGEGRKKHTVVYGIIPSLAFKHFELFHYEFEFSYVRICTRFALNSTISQPCWLYLAYVIQKEYLFGRKNREYVK